MNWAVIPGPPVPFPGTIVRIGKAGRRLKLGEDVQCVNPEDDPRFRQYWETYHHIMGREGVTQEEADSVKAQLEEAGATVELK